jgi:S-adenosylmethionine decarboxylase
MEIINFGEHLMLDGYFGNEEKLNNKEIVLKSLGELCEKLGMRQLTKPEVYFAPGNDIKDPGGWSGFVVIEESHISIHTFPKKGFVSADVYTCRNGMDTKLVENYLRNTFELKEAEVQFTKRGTKYPVENIY